MPFVKGSVSDRIEQKRQESEEFRKLWDESRGKYRSKRNTGTYKGKKLLRRKIKSMKRNLLLLISQIKKARGGTGF